jgi:hypothetical protein
MDPDPKVVVGTVLVIVDGTAEVVWVVKRVVRLVVVIGLSRVDGRYVNLVGIRYVEVELRSKGVGVVKRRKFVVLPTVVVGSKVVVVSFTVTVESTEDTGKVVFSTGDVVIGFTVVVKVGRVVVGIILVVVNGTAVEVDVV